MKRGRGWLLLCYFALLLPMPFTRAEGSVLGKGWTLGPGGSIATAPSEVISGRASIKASSTQPNTFVPFLYTDPTIVRFAPSQTYTLTLRYRILKAASGTFSLDFNSPTAIAGGVFGPGTAINGPDGATGTATLSATLQAYGDYRLSFGVFGTGSIVIDDIRITGAGGSLVAAEGAEGPSFAPGPLAWQIIDAMSLLTPSSSTVISAARGDLDGDGYPEVVLALTAPRPSTTPIEPLILQASKRLRIANAEFFPAGMLTVKNSPMILFVDINGDGLIDLLISDAGSDDPPSPGSKIGVGLNLGGGKFRDVSALIPLDLQATRSYAIAAGDIDGDGRVEIILPDQSRGGNTAALRWNGSGFDAQRDWIPPSIWMYPNNLFFQTWMAVADFDRDGKQDLLVTGDPGSPTMRIVFGDSSGVSNGTLIQLPAGPWGWVVPSQTRLPIEQGAEVGPVVVADLDNDGLPDIFAIERQIIYFQPGAITDTDIPGYASIHANGGYFPSTASLQVLMNRGARQFVDVSQRSSIQALQRAQYNGLIPLDLNNDGFVDLVGLYISEPYGDSRALTWGTTFFLNDGTGAFQVVDGSQVMGVTTTPSNGQQWSLGAFVPTRVTRERTEGVVFEGVGGCGVNLCEAVGLKLYRVVADGAMGTGPNFADPGPLGAPGFNEFYYLRRYADAAAAVRAGQYASGLAHYLAIGKARGYFPSAAFGVPTNLMASSADSSVTLNWSSPAEGTVSSYWLEAGSAPGLSDLAKFSTGTAATTFSASGVANGTYYVRMKSIVGGAMSAPSNEIAVTLGPCAAAPAAPSGLMASVAGSAVTLRWTASVGAPQSYVLDAGTAPGRADIVSASLGSTVTNFTAPSVAPGIYYGRIKAVNACGTSGPSNEVVVSVGAAAH